MKTAVVVVYVAAVLLFSAFARAEMVIPFSTGEAPSTRILIDEVYANEVTLELDIHGRLANPCHALPTARLSQDLNTPNTLVLRLSSPLPLEACVSPVAKYVGLVSLPETAQVSNLQLEDKAIYLLKVEGSEFEMMVLGSELMRVPGFLAQ